MNDQRKPNWADKLNALLVPYIGPPPLGPYGEAPLPPTGLSACPMCGVVMSAHEVERRDGRPTKLHCPVPAA
ncbi:hypothetical protein [Homoserinimonas sp. A520]